MRSSLPCPACGLDGWRAAGAHRYRRSDLAPDGAALTSYERLRLRVLFEVWQPDSDEVDLRVVICARCGFVCYLPRPDEGELEAKYRFLLEEEAPSGVQLERAIRADRARAERTYDAVARHAARTSGRVLDYGGAEGRLLMPFRDHAWECELVDYPEGTLPGVKRLGATLDDVPAGRRYDAVICSHVLEHLAEPGAVLRALREILKPDGVLFAEVPVDLWRGPPIARDPVTHVNFFTPLTLEQLLARNGYRVRECAGITGSYAGVVKDVAVAVASPGDGSTPDPRRALEEAEALLRPTLRMELGRLWRHRARFGAAARRIIGRRRAPGASVRHGRAS
jgi:SAM-dependent methyltransferase